MRVLLFTNYKQQYEQEFKMNQFNVIDFIPLLQTTFNDAAAIEFTKYNGVVLTSAKAAKVFASVCKRLALPVYVVGRATFEVVKEFEHVLGSNSGSANELVKVLEEHVQDGQRYLFLCGDKALNTIPEYFRSRGVALDQVVVYETKPVDHVRVLPKDVDWVVFFSPSGVQAAGDLKLFENNMDVKKATIGKTTAMAMEEMAVTSGDSHWIPNAIASVPTASGVVQAMVDYEAKFQS